jgi:hypothetical protein
MTNKSTAVIKIGAVFATPKFKPNEPSIAGVLEKNKLPKYDVRCPVCALLNNINIKLTVKMSNVVITAATRQLMAINIFFIPKTPF